MKLVTQMFTFVSGFGAKFRLGLLHQSNLEEFSPSFLLKVCYASYDEHKAQADEQLQKEVQKGYVQWAANRSEGPLHLAMIAVVLKGAKMRLIHDLRKNGTNARVTFQERLVLPRTKDLVAGIMDLPQAKTQGEGVDLLTLDLRDAFKQLHVVETERRFLAGTTMDGCFSYRTVLFGVGSGPLVWCRVAAWVMRSTQAWLSNNRAQTNCFVDDPIIAIRGTVVQRRRLAMGVLLLLCYLGLRLAYEKGFLWPGCSVDRDRLPGPVGHQQS